MATEPPSVPAAPQSADGREVSALVMMLWFGVLQLAGLVAGWAASLYLFGGAFSSFTAFPQVRNATSVQTAAALGPAIRSMTLVLPVTGAVEIIALAILAIGFWGLRRVDRTFSVPSILTIVMVVGGGLAVAGGVGFFGSVSNIITQAPTASASLSSAEFSSAVASLFIAFFMLAIGGLLTLIGFIGGELLGLWRAGSRYNETLLKLGAIFTIIPFLNLAAPVLIIVGASQARSRLRAGTA
ncbi:MAG: DUF973 family protein [Nitrososphaerota archaeon]|nr:DUF973 family protein [Nitrososphaerota archaeon]